MAQVEPATKILSELIDEEIEESRNVSETFEHLVINILADLREEELYSSRLHCKEDEEQFNKKSKI